MNDFTASNGGTVETIASGRVIVRDDTPFEYPDGTTRTGQISYLDPGQIIALREFFQAEADERYGRWRWQHEPEFVAYWHPVLRHLTVIYEPAGGSTVFEPDSMPPEPIGGKPAAVARAYFDAHPEPKPWTRAEAGELWFLTITALGPETNLRWEAQGDPVRFWSGGLHIDARSDEITAGRRIWPEVTSRD